MDDRAETGAAPEPKKAGRCPVFAGYDPQSPEELRDPQPSFRRARAEMPVFLTSELGLYSVTRHEDVLSVLRDNETFVGPPLIMEPPPEVPELKEYPWKIITSLGTEEHRPARKLIQAPFTPRRVAALEPYVREKANKLLDPLEQTGQIEFVNEFGFPLSLAVIGNIIGVPEDKFDMLKKAASAAFLTMSATISGANHDEIIAAARDIKESLDFTEELIAERRANPREDYTSVMLAQEMPDGNPPDDETMFARIYDLLMAGFETTAQAMPHGVYSILSHPEQWELLKEDPDLVEDAVEEMLRYQGLVKRIFRLSTRDAEVGGVAIPAGSLIGLALASANHDEDVYEDPEHFDITRGRSDHLAFGKWRHFCVGAPLARLEMKVMLEILIERFPDLRIVDDWVEGPADMTLLTISRLELAPR